MQDKWNYSMLSTSTGLYDHEGTTAAIAASVDAMGKTMTTVCLMQGKFSLLTTQQIIGFAFE
jgi:hypothetical protein